MDKLQIEYIPIGELKPFAGNPRKHPDDAVDKLVKSIEAFGWTNPILLDAEGMILAGHARLKAATKAGVKTVPVIRLPLSGDDAKMYVIADNKTAELTDWDWPALGDLFQELDNGELDLELSAFGEHEIGGLLGGLDEASGNATEWDGMPEFVQNDESGIKAIIVHFKTQEDINEFSKLIGQNITEKTKSIWYPKAERVSYIDQGYKAT
ncbi:MAG: ParB N-terminal domain-containing protein [FCB group bacterium]|nr:ParB N-terminal domain-containing protein [FCB group bacterium]